MAESVVKSYFPSQTVSDVEKASPEYGLEIARAIENECYVAIAGSVGNLPKVDNVDIQYGQTAVFSPSDFAFPHDAIVSETTPNTEMTLIVDLDLDKLTKLQNEGSVRNYLDRRRDLYRVEWIGDKQ